MVTKQASPSLPLTFTFSTAAVLGSTLLGSFRLSSLEYLLLRKAGIAEAEIADHTLVNDGDNYVPITVS
jgi:hypothetical protein